MISLREMRFAVMLASCGNFSAAAKKLYISQPSLSQAIKSLELELGVALFERKGSPLKLTPAGELFVQEATAILERSAHLEKEMQSLARQQSIHIGISPFYGRYYLPGCLSQFKRKYPSVELHVVENSSNNLEQLLLEKQLDIAFLPLPLQNPSLKYLPVLNEEIFFATPKSLPIAGNPQISQGSRFPIIHLAQFSHMPFIYLKNRQRFTVLGNALCREEGFEPQIAFESENWETIDAMIGKGMGVGFVPEILVSGENPIKPRYFHIASPNNTRQYVAAYTDERKLTVTIRDLIGFMSEVPIRPD